jgi:hypothetical protein
MPAASPASSARSGHSRLVTSFAATKFPDVDKAGLVTPVSIVSGVGRVGRGMAASVTSSAPSVAGSELRPLDGLPRLLGTVGGPQAPPRQCGGVALQTATEGSTLTTAPDTPGRGPSSISRSMAWRTADYKRAFSKMAKGTSVGERIPGRPCLLR